MKPIHINIKQLRIANRLKQREVAEALGVPLTNYGAYEEGRAMPPLDITDKICDLFSVTLKELIGTGNLNRKQTIEARYSAAPLNVRKAIDLLLN